MSVTTGLHEDGKLPALELSNRAASGGDPRSLQFQEVRVLWGLSPRFRR